MGIILHPTFNPEFSTGEILILLGCLVIIVILLDVGKMISKILNKK